MGAGKLSWGLQRGFFRGIAGNLLARSVWLQVLKMAMPLLGVVRWCHHKHDNKGGRSLMLMMRGRRNGTMMILIVWDIIGMLVFVGLVHFATMLAGQVTASTSTVFFSVLAIKRADLQIIRS